VCFLPVSLLSFRWGAFYLRGTGLGGWQRKACNMPSSCGQRRGNGQKNLRCHSLDRLHASMIKQKATVGERRNQAVSHPNTPLRLSKNQAPISATATVMAHPSQATTHHCRYSTSHSPATSMATNAPESCLAGARFPGTKAKATGAPAIQPTGTTTPTMANGHRLRRKRGQNATKAGTPVKITLALAVVQRRRQRYIRAEPSPVETPARHKGTNKRRGSHYAHTGRDSKACGSRDCSGASSRATSERKPDKRLKAENGKLREI